MTGYVIQYFPECAVLILLRWRDERSGVDSLTHVLAVMLAAHNTLSGPYLFALVLGAVIPDIDILFKPFSDRHPSLYMFTHGGVTHSIPGAVAMAPLVLTGSAVAVAGGAFPVPDQGLTWVLMGIFFIFGTFTHLFLDALAYPGIPLLYPVSPQKYTVGIFPGPSLVIFSASLIFATLFLLGSGAPTLIWIYAAFFILFILASGGIALAVRAGTRGRAIPTLHPLRWFILAEDDEKYILSSVNLLSEPGPEQIFPKYRNTTPQQLDEVVKRPEYQRLKFYSYIITANRDGDQVVFTDPLRAGRIIFYPPYYTEIALPAPETA
jgi:inner membrane protein